MDPNELRKLAHDTSDWRVVGPLRQAADEVEKLWADYDAAASCLVERIIRCSRLLVDVERLTAEIERLRAREEHLLREIDRLQSQYYGPEEEK